jgi:hypothetical protein
MCAFLRDLKFPIKMGISSVSGVNSTLSLTQTLEAPIHSEEKAKVLKAIRAAGKTVRVADISRDADLPVLKATELLNRIAYETGGHLIVDTAGGIAYKFDPGFENAYLLKGTGTLMQRLGRMIVNACLAALRIFCLAMFFVVRLSFGVMLVLSVVVVIGLLLVLLLRFLGDNDSDGGFDFGDMFDGAVFRGITYWTFDWLWDWFFWWRYITWEPSYRWDAPVDIEPRRKQSAKESPKDRTSFLDNCFAFLFGHGDPNKGFEETQWSTIARVLAANQGVVIAENVAPYVPVVTPNEDWMLPVLVRFNGSPEVSETGTIIYSFPEFQRAQSTQSTVATQNAGELQDLYAGFLNRQASMVNSQQIAMSLPKFLTEKNWQFCELSSTSKGWIIGFAAFVVVGSVSLMLASASYSFLGPFMPLLAAILGYGLLFAVVPGIRYLVEQRLNEKIDKRNASRILNSHRLDSKEPAVLTRLNEARDVRLAALDRAAGVAYTTETDLLDQQFGVDGKPLQVQDGEGIAKPRNVVEDVDKRW